MKKQAVVKKHIGEYVAQSNLGERMKLKMSHLMEVFHLHNGGHRRKTPKKLGPRLCEDLQRLKNVLFGGAQGH